MIHPVFDFKDPRPGGGLGGVSFSDEWLSFKDKSIPCAPSYLNVSQRFDAKNLAIWSKVPLYRQHLNSSQCLQGVWDSLVNTALDLRDGTMLITGGKYIFRVRQSDLSPVGAAPNLHVVDAAEVKRVIDSAKGKNIPDASAYLSEQLHLR
ncbi:MAG: hypothetical protein JSS56_27865 [Proteobacteria bacterium]|nr:hypothetical protein [Pseudomonadota bacterium]